MEPTSTGSIRTARWFLVALFAVNFYRAMTQSVTPGEAWNYHRFIAPSWADSFAHYDANNHVINTLLVRISIATFHLTELSLRLPSLLAGALYLWVVFRLSRRWFGSGPAFLTVVGLLTLNPLVVDALSEARGYGMALASWTWALELILESMQSFSHRKLNLAAMSLGLSVAASLAFAAPAVALLAAFALCAKREECSARSLALIFLLTAFLFLVIPLNHAELKTFASGATSLRQTINELTTLSLGTSLKAVGAIARFWLSFLALAGCVAFFRYRGRQAATLVSLTSAALPLTLLLLIAANRWLHTPFPQEAAVYLIPLTVLPVATVILKRNYKTAQIAFQLASAVLLICYVTQFPFGMYASGSQFAGARIVAKMLRANAGQAPIRVYASLDAEPIVSYYRLRYRQGTWQQIERQPLNGAYHYYVLTPRDAAVIEQRHLHVMYRDAGLTLAR